jgi:cation diffusion facilitator family transporter
MRLYRPFVYPAQIDEEIGRARKLAWASLVLLISTALAIYLTLGQSEAMKTAWIEDLLGLVPPIVLLIALRVERRTPNKRFPYGYFRVVSVAFLVTAAVLSLAGMWLLYDALMKLLKGERPPIGVFPVFGHDIWAGWAMIAALCYCIIIGIILGKLKQPVAKKLNDKALAADADMNKAGWMSEGAAVVGILLIAFGFWWGDAVAAAFISVNIIRDGWVSLRQVVADLMDESPTRFDSTELDRLPERIKQKAESLPWVRKAAVRLREHGHVISGDVMIVPADETNLIRNIAEASRVLCEIDWRLYRLIIMPVSTIDEETENGSKEERRMAV